MSTFPRLFQTIAATVALFTSTTVAVADWEKLVPLPESNGGFAWGTSANGIIVVGGTHWKDGEKLWLNSVHRYDPKAKRWQASTELEHAFAYGPFGHREKSGDFVILGGSDGEAPRKSLLTFAAKSTEVAPIHELPDQVVLSAGGIVGDQFLIVGGTDDAANIAGMTTKAFSIDLKTKTITSLPDYPGKPFAISASAVIGKELFIFGGANWDADTETVSNTTDGYAFSVETNKWRKLKSHPLDLRGHAAVALDDHRIYIAGGYGGEPAGFLPLAFIYDIRTDSYTKAKPLPYAATAGLVILDDYLYCIGGEDQMKSRSDAFWRVRVKDL